MEETSIVRLEAWRLLHAEEGLPYLRQALPLTDWEGGLDLLADALSEWDKSLGLVLIGADLLRESSWGKRLLGVLTQATHENPALHLVFRD